MQRARLWYKVVLAAVFCIAVVSFFGCSQQKRYQVLTFFFDGVPAPGGGVKGGAQPVAYVHKPYADGKCGACHASDDIEMSITRAVDISEIPSTTCLKCHAKVVTAYPVMHGPVVSAECLMCHAPHDSPNAHLLNVSAPRLCVQCHTPENMLPMRPEHKDASADCLTCHFGHGGPSHGLLRPKQPVAGTAVAPLQVAEGGTRL